ncbi:MAG: PEP-CTERM sorting domain-containing protein [Nitrospiraceae bacterium]
MVRTLRSSVLAVSAFLWIGFVDISPAVSVPLSYNTGLEYVTSALSTPQYTPNHLFPSDTYGPFGSQVSYRQSFDGTALTKQVDVGFVFGPGFSDGQKSAFRTAAVTGIESIWNNKFMITDTVNNRAFPLTVAVMTAGPVFDQSVTVHSGSGRADVHNWYAASATPQVMAHEVGHMIGLYDEYIGGSVDKYPNPTLSNAGLMGLGANSEKPEMHPRYYQGYLDFMNALNPGGNFILAAVVAPEPSTLFLVVSGITGLLVSRRLEGFRVRLR